jgi:hypothetical protein
MRSIRKISLILFVGIIGFFATGCNGTTSVYGLDKSGKNHHYHKKHPKKKKPTYHARYETRKPIPPGHKKKYIGIVQRKNILQPLKSTKHPNIKDIIRKENINNKKRMKLIFILFYF